MGASESGCVYRSWCAPPADLGGLTRQGKGVSLYPILRLMMPKLDAGRYGHYNLKALTIAE